MTEPESGGDGPESAYDDQPDPAAATSAFLFLTFASHHAYLHSLQRSGI